MQIEKPPSKNKPFKKCFSSLVSLCLWRPNKSCKQCFAQSKNRTDITHWDFLPKSLSLRCYTTLEGVFGVQRSRQGQGTIIFRLFPIISISQKFFSFFFLRLEKIGTDEKVICYHNISNILWKKDVLCVWKKSESQKHYKFSPLRPRICKLFSRVTFFSSH